MRREYAGGNTSTCSWPPVPACAAKPRGDDHRNNGRDVRDFHLRPVAPFRHAGWGGRGRQAPLRLETGRSDGGRRRRDRAGVSRRLTAASHLGRVGRTRECAVVAVSLARARGTYRHGTHAFARVRRERCHDGRLQVYNASVIRERIIRQFGRTASGRRHERERERGRAHERHFTEKSFARGNSGVCSFSVLRLENNAPRSLEVSWKGSRIRVAAMIGFSFLPGFLFFFFFSRAEFQIHATPMITTRREGEREPNEKEADKETGERTGS